MSDGWDPDQYSRFKNERAAPSSISGAARVS
jgi:trans-aconitate methyltransferase